MGKFTFLKRCCAASWQSILALFIFCMPLISHGQELLTLDQTLAVALEQNYDLKISSNNVKKAEVEHNVGNAGMLPEVKASMGINRSVGNVSQNTFVGTTNEINGATNGSKSLNVTLDQTLFDGLTMFRTYDKLGKRVEFQNLKYQEEVENMVTQVISSYYDVVGNQKKVKLLRQSLAYGNEQNAEIRKRKDAGRASLIDVLNSEVNLAEDSASLFEAQSALQNSINYLGFLMGGQDLASNTFEQELLVNASVLSQLGSFDVESNVLVKQANANIKITELDYAIYQGAKYPQIFGSTGVNVNNSTSDYGFANNTNSVTWSIGLTARWAIFQGFKRNIQLQTNQLEQLNQAVTKQKVKQNLIKDYNDAKATFNAALNVIKLREGNLSIYQKQYDVTLQLYKMGRQTSLEMRNAQEQLLNAKNELFVAKKEAKLQEVELLRLSGKLLD